MNKEVSQTGEAPKTSKKCLWVWALLLLLPIVQLLPMWGGLIQHQAIGAEYLCCALSTVPEYVAQAEQAKSLHWLSNLIIGGSIVLALILLIGICIIIYRYGIPKRYPKPLQIIMKVILFVFTAPTILLLIMVTSYFITDNSGYYKSLAQPPGPDNIYYYVWHR